MLSRVADSIYWMSRYIERAENVARFIDVTLNLAIRSGAWMDGAQWAPLVYTTGDTTCSTSGMANATQERDPVPDLRRKEPELDSVLPAQRPRKCPHRARDDLFGRCGKSSTSST